MNFNIDSVIFIGFLIANLILGLYSSSGIRNIKEYAVGDRKFSTATIVSTIVATWVGGSFLFTIASESYKNGLYFIWVLPGDLVEFLLIAIVFAPRVGEFLGKLSIAEAMGSLYGEKVRIITAICSFIGVVGIISVQLKVAGIAFEYALGISSGYGAIITGVLITIYSSLGGIKAVTFTDIIQFITFGIVIPVIGYFLLRSLSSMESLTNIIATNPLFDYKQVFDFSQKKSLYYLFLFLFFSIPGFNPAMFQRISMARSTDQVAKSFTISAFTCVALALSVCWIGVLTLAIHPDINPNDVMKTVIADCSQVLGFKGVILAGVMAMVMSTVDSYINATSVIVVHDFFKPLKIKILNDELLSARIVSFVIGTVSIVLSLRQGSLLSLFISARSFYSPIISTPFIMAVLGFRSSTKSVMFGMSAGLITVLLWKYFDIQVVDNIIPAMFANLVVLVGSHYLLKQPGGWVGIKDPAPLQAVQMRRKLKFQQFIRAVKNFNFLDACYQNKPKGDGLISILGAFVMITTFSSVNLMPVEFRNQYQYLLDVFYPIAIASSSPLMSYPLWLNKWQKTRAIGIVWNLIAFFVLICFSCLMVFISNFSEMPLISFLINVLLISSLVSWRWALSSIVLGVGVVTFCYSHYISSAPDIFGSETKIVYMLLLISALIVLFFKPKQEEHELTEEKVEHLGVRIGDREEELQKLLELKSEFLRNLEHEVRTPITGITSMAETLYDSCETMDPKQLKECLSIIAKSSERFNTYSRNILDLSKLSSLTYELNKTNVNLSELVLERLDRCRKLYINGKALEFVTQITPDIQISCDQHYITSTIDNLIINAISYSKEGKITITLEKIDNNVEFSITDEGIGIPPSELFDIFGAFVVSSKTRTPSGGRGVGTALCKKVVEVHRGKIWAESDGEKGATFRFILPLSV